MRRQDNVFLPEQSRFGFWLGFEHVESRPGDFLLLQGIGERRLVHHRPTRRIDQICGRCDFLEIVFGYQVPRVGPERGV